MPVPQNISTTNQYDNKEDSRYIVRSQDEAFEYPNIAVGQYFAKQIESHPSDAIAFLDPNNNGQMTYGQLHEKCQEIALALIELGVTKNDFVMFYSDNSLEYAIAMIATFYLGLPFCPIPPASGAFELTEQIKGANGTVLVFGPNKLATVEKALQGDSYCKIIKDHLRVVVELDVDQPDQWLVQHSAMDGKTIKSFDQLQQIGFGQRLKTFPHFPIEDPSNEHFLICFTSGTTGTPKGAIHTHGSYLATLINTKLWINDFGQRVTVWHPMGHISGTLIVPHCLDVGTVIVLFADNNIDTIMEAVQRLRINQLFFSPNQATPLALKDYEQQYDLSSLKCAKYGGSRIAENLLQLIKDKYQVRMFELYGATEFLGHVRVRDPLQTWDNFEPGNCGTVTPNVEMKIVDLQNGEALPAYQPGEICFRGPARFRGYLNNEQATKSTIDQGGWYHSGDVGYYDHTGSLFISDRIKEMIKYKLYTITPAEIEDFLHRHEAVAAVCVVGVSPITDVNLIRAYVQVLEGKSATEQELIDYVKDNMGFQKRLRAGVRFVTNVPRTVIGKVDRQYFKRLVKHELLTEPVP